MTAILKRIAETANASLDGVEDTSAFAARLDRLAEERKAPITARRDA